MDHLPPARAPSLEELTTSFAGKKIGFAFDAPRPLAPGDATPFPDDATAEWESLPTLEAIASAWERLGFEVVRLPLEGDFFLNWHNVFSKLDLVHSVVEGFGSEAREGWLPSLCEMSGVPFLGSPPLAQGVAMRKHLLKRTCADLGIPVARSHLVAREEDLRALPDDLLAAPHFVKPDAEGSGMGVDARTSVSTDPERTRAQARELLTRYPDGVLVEEFLPGEEYTTALVGEPLLPLPVARIEVNDGVYGLANKSKEFMGEKVTFPSLDPVEERALAAWGRRLADATGMRDFVRFDWRRDARGVVTFLEANPLAGLSPHYSVLPVMAREAGFSFEALLGHLARGALARGAHRSLWYGRARLKRATP